MNLISVMELMQSFQWVVFKKNQSPLPCKFIVFEGDFYPDLVLIFLLVLLVEISNSCVSRVAIENISLLSFALVIVMLRIAYLLYK